MLANRIFGEHLGVYLVAISRPKAEAKSTEKGTRVPIAEAAPDSMHGHIPAPTQS